MAERGFIRGIGPLEGVFLGLTLLLAGIHLYVGLFAPAVPDQQATQFLVIALAFVAGFLVRLTPFWRPVLYLLGVGFAVFLGGLWLLGGVELFYTGIITGVVATVFIILALYLFIREELRATAA